MTDHVIFFQQLTPPMAGNFSLDWLKFCCFTNILKVITFSSSTWHTFSLLIFVKCCLQTIFLQKQRRILQNREFSFFFLLSVSESITKVFCWYIYIVWIRTIFWRTLIFWDTSIYVVQTIRENNCKRFTEKFFIPNSSFQFAICSLREKNDDDVDNVCLCVCECIIKFM